MKFKFTFLPWALLLILTANGQNAENGLFHSGVAIPWIPDQDDVDSSRAGIRLENALIMVDLYPGFSVVKASFRFLNPSPDTLTLTGRFPLRGLFRMNPLGQFNFDRAAPLRIRVDSRELPVPEIRDTLQPEFSKSYNNKKDNLKMEAAVPVSFIFKPGGPTTCTFYYLTKNNQAVLTKDGLSRDANAFCFYIPKTDSRASAESVGQVLVRTKDKLSIQSIRGILPDSGVEGDLKHLAYRFVWAKDQLPNSMVIWYDGAPPDFQFEKKILPLVHNYFLDIDQFPIGEFEPGRFQAVQRNNFETKRSNNFLAGLIYFIMFITPWIILGAFLIYFLWGGKKRKRNPL